MARPRWFLVFAGLLASLAIRPLDAQNQEASPAYRHGYYLFLADTPVACEACYVPLLVTTGTLEEVAKRPEGESCVLITTYERDSIWQIKGMVQVKPAEIQAAPRIVRVRNRSYRYQEITAAEILHLLENPSGTIPISRILPYSDLTPGPSREQLIADFRATR
jgi:hypothetical protein